MSSILAADFIVGKLRNASLEVEVVKVYENENLLIPIIHREEVKHIPKFAFSLYEKILEKIGKIATDKTENHFILDTDKILLDFPISKKRPSKAILRKISDGVDENFIDLPFIDIATDVSYYFPNPIEFVEFGINFKTINFKAFFDKEKLLTEYEKEKNNLSEIISVEEKIISTILSFFFSEEDRTFKIFNFRVIMTRNDKLHSYFSFDVDLTKKKNELCFIMDLKVFPIVEAYVINLEKMI